MGCRQPAPLQSSGCQILGSHNGGVPYSLTNEPNSGGEKETRRIGFVENLRVGFVSARLRGTHQHRRPEPGKSLWRVIAEAIPTLKNCVPLLYSCFRKGTSRWTQTRREPLLKSESCCVLPGSTGQFENYICRSISAKKQSSCAIGWNRQVSGASG